MATIYRRSVIKAAVSASGIPIFDSDIQVQSLKPVISTSLRNLSFDFPGIEIGCAEYSEGPTGCTVFHFPKGATVSCDIRGGSPGLIMAADGYADAICFAGGSLYGLEAVTGVSAELLKRRGFKHDQIAVVRGAVIYDFTARSNSIYADKLLGQAACRAVTTGTFPLGRHGAGSAAGVGGGLDFLQGEWAGQGGAFLKRGQVRIAVFTVVNSVGAIYDREGKIVRGNLDRKTGKRSSFMEQLEAISKLEAGKPSRNTTLTLAVTNLKLDAFELTQVGRQIHSSMARAIQPFHTGLDGDTCFLATTNEVSSKLTGTGLGVLASELAWDAVLTSY